MINRGNIIKSFALLPLATLPKEEKLYEAANTLYRLKTSLNAFSFNKPLMAKEMDLYQLLDFCAENQFDAVDITGYYFPGYPDVPSNEFIFSIKRTAQRLGLAISGTGVRNDFTMADKEKREEQILLIKKWIEVAAKLGAPVIRIFAGAGALPQGYTWEQIAA
jgi:sugar phosphate isomerase/epimerase